MDLSKELNDPDFIRGQITALLMTTSALIGHASRDSQARELLRLQLLSASAQANATPEPEAFVHGAEVVYSLLISQLQPEAKL